MAKACFEKRQAKLVAGYLRECGMPSYMFDLFLSFVAMRESFNPIPKLQRLFDVLLHQKETITLSSVNRHYDSVERLIFTEWDLLAIFKHPLFDRCDTELYRHVLRMMHRLHHETPSIAASDACAEELERAELYCAAHKIRLILVLQSHPNFLRFLSSSRLHFWNSWIRDIAPKLGKDPRALIGLRLPLD